MGMVLSFVSTITLTGFHVRLSGSKERKRREREDRKEESRKEEEGKRKERKKGE